MLDLASVPLPAAAAVALGYLVSSGNIPQPSAQRWQPRSLCSVGALTALLTYSLLMTRRSTASTSVNLQLLADVASADGDASAGLGQVRREVGEQLLRGVRVRSPGP
jgi:hypothetical protein